MHVDREIRDLRHPLAQRHGVLGPIDHVVGGAILPAACQHADGMRREQEPVMRRPIEALVGAIERIDQHRRIEIAVADILDRDHREAVPELLLEFGAGEIHLPAQQHGVLHQPAPDGFLQRRNHLVGRKAVLGGGALPGVRRLLHLGHLPATQLAMPFQSGA